MEWSQQSDYGILIEIENGVEGLCHKDMFTIAQNKLKTCKPQCKIQSVECQILEIIRKKKVMPRHKTTNS